MNEVESTKVSPRRRSGWLRLLWVCVLAIVCVGGIAVVREVQRFLVIRNLESRGVKMTWVNHPPQWYVKYVSRTWTPPIFQRLTRIQATRHPDTGETINITDSEIAALGQQELLYDITLSGSQITDIGMKRLGPLPNVHHLRLYETSVADLDWLDTAQMEELRHVNLGNSKLNDKGLERLAALPKLNNLVAIKANITGAGLSSICRSKSLRELFLIGTPIVDEDLKSLSKMLQLQTLQLGETRINGSGIKYLKPLQNLDELDLSKTDIRDEALLNLEGMKGLRTLRLDQTAITDRGLSYLAAVPTLQRLALNQTKATISGLKPLKHLEDITRLSISNPEPLTDDDVQTLKPFYYLESLNIHETSFTPEILESLASLPYMEYLSFVKPKKRIPTDQLREIEARHPKVKIRFVD